jgi:hypothetical protein
MSVARILVSGVLVAGGLVLGAFSAAGYLDPQWAQNQLAATARREPAGEQKSLSVFRRTRFVSKAVTDQRALDRTPVRVSTKASPKTFEVRPAKGRPASRPPSKKKVIERGKVQPPKAQQTAAQFQWPWKLFGN